MITVFFLFNAPVNEALNGWTSRNVTDQLQHLSAAVGDRPRVRGCSGRHCLCRADAAVEARADEMNAQIALVIGTTASKMASPL